MPKKKAYDWIEENKNHIIKISDSIWSFAELGLIEFKSSKLLADELELHGFKVDMGIAGMPTAFIATWGKGKPVIGINGEYDALPGLSQKTVPFKDPIIEGGIGHGCGHNIHGTSGMAGAIAAKVVMKEEGIPGTIKFFGCPAEENASGKVWMVRDGVYENIDAILGHHPGSGNGSGLSSSLANNSVKFHFYGKTAHAAASPDQGRSALDAIELMNIGVNFLREHIMQEARIHYVIEHGGGQPNVVPDYARSWYLIRAPERYQLEPIYERILKIAEGAKLMTETDMKIEFIKGIYNKIPNRTLSELLISNMREIETPVYTDDEMKFAEEIAKSISRESKISSLRKRNRPNWEDLVDVLIDQSIVDAYNEGKVGSGSTDVACPSWQAPTQGLSTTAFVLGTPGHSWQITAQSGMGLGHKSLIFGAKTLAASVIDLLTKPEILKNAWEEFNERKKGLTYKTPLPKDAKPPLDLWSK